MKKYLKVSLIEAEPATLREYGVFLGSQLPQNDEPLSPGYKITPKEGISTWCSKDAFVDYHELDTGETITDEDIDRWIHHTKIQTVGNKTTMVVVLLKNGFEIIETSAAIDWRGYSEIIGAEVCIEKIRERVKDYLSFLLHCTRG